MKRTIYLIAILSLSVLSLAFIACGGGDGTGDDRGDSNAGASAEIDGSPSDGDSVSDATNDDGTTLDDILEDLPIDEDGNFDADSFADLNFGRAGDEAYAIAGEACLQWSVWDIDEGQSGLGDILVLATEAMQADDVRDPVLVRLESDVSSLMLALQRGDGTAVIDLNSSVIDEDCSAIF